MKVLRLFSVLLIAVLLGLAVGFVLRRKGSYSREVSGLDAARRADAAIERSGVSRNASESMPVMSVAQKLERDLATSKGVVQWLYWMEAIEKASLDDMPRLARLASKNEPAIRMVALRWAKLNPKHMFDSLLRRTESGEAYGWQFENTLFTEWAKRDPDALIKALDEAGPFGLRDRWRSTVASSVLDQDPERGLKLMAQWHIENFSPNMDGVVKWVARNPRHAADFVLSMTSYTGTRDAATTVGREWGKADPAAALEFVGNRRGELSSALAAAALSQWAKTDLGKATKWLANTDASSRNRLSPAVVESWAEKDPAGALLWSEANLTGTSLAEAAKGVLKGAADRDVTAAARLVTAMQPSSARASGALAVAEKWLPNLSFESSGTKPEALAWLRSLDPESVRTVLDQLHTQWAQSDSRSIVEFLNSLSVEHISAHVYENVAANYARFEPRNAIEWASNTPEYARMQAGGDALTAWYRAQPEEARQWWSQLAANDPRRKTFYEAAVRNLAWHWNPTEQFAGLAAFDPETARAVIDKMGLEADRHTALLRAIGPER